MKIKFADAPAKGSIAVPAFENAALSDSAKTVDTATAGALTRAIKSSRFKGGAGESLVINAPSGIDADRVETVQVSQRCIQLFV